MLAQMPGAASTSVHVSYSLCVLSRFPRPHLAYAGPFKTGVAQDLGAWDGAAAERCGNQLCLAICADTLRIILGCFAA
jgi:hypothetical protein